MSEETEPPMNMGDGAVFNLAAALCRPIPKAPEIDRLTGEVIRSYRERVVLNEAVDTDTLLY